ncbi:hypothetical protein Franean1_1401 [Parafrankia sp. EAN1pec]|nr:hypothetical protein Franean1_1401 [Frankia sp. EAN1pec]
MARPSLPLGTYGKITVYPTGARYRARCKYRDFDGVTRQVERYGSTSAAAERELKTALRDRVHVSGSEEITPDTKVAVVAELWWLDFQKQGKSPGTLRSYRDRLDRQILPGLGNLRIRELTPGATSRFLGAVAEKHGAGIAKLCRAVLNGVSTLALRHDALDRSPVRDIGKVASTKPRKQARALSVAEVRQLRAYISYDATARSRDLPEFVDMMIATGYGSARPPLWSGTRSTSTRAPWKFAARWSGSRAKGSSSSPNRSRGTVSGYSNSRSGASGCSGHGASGMAGPGDRIPFPRLRRASVSAIRITPRSISMPCSSSQGSRT